MCSETVKVNLASDAEARPVAVLVQKASQFESKVYIQSGDKKINAKSIMGVMTLCTADCEEIEVVAEGEDAEKAVDHIEKYLKNEGN